MNPYKVIAQWEERGGEVLRLLGRPRSHHSHGFPPIEYVLERRERDALGGEAWRATETFFDVDPSSHQSVDQFRAHQRALERLHNVYDAGIARAKEKK